MAYHHLGAWLLGLEGAALLRAQAEGSTAEGFEARFDEIGRILVAIRSGELAVGWHAEAVTATAGYAVWSSAYDGPNPLIDVEEPLVRELVAAVEPGIALDAACGTGRHTAFLAEAGHRAVGTDRSPEMLALARGKVPDATFVLGDLQRLPLGDAAVDLAVCSLALTHLPGLDEPLAELARVVRPGGTVVVSDIHWVSLYLGGVPQVTLPSGTIARLPASRFTAADYIRAALAAGLTIEACHEPPWPDMDGHGGDLAQRWCPAAARAASVGTPAAIVWKFRRDS